MIILLRSMYERNEYSTMLQKETNELMHTSNKENKQYATYQAVLRSGFPQYCTGFHLHSTITEGVVFLW